MTLNINSITLDALGNLTIPRGTTAQRNALTSVVGDLFFDTDFARLFIYTASGWQLAGAIDHGELTGLGDDDHAQYLLTNGSRTLTGDQNCGGKRLTNLGAPTSATDAATKEYVDDGKVWKDEVLAMQNSPPGSPSDGDRYIVVALASGAWTGKETYIAEWDAGLSAWVFDGPPAAGWTCFNVADSKFKVFTGLAWSNWEANVDHSSLTNLHTGPTAPDDHPQYLLKNTADMKVGSVASGSFSGTPRKATVTFTTAMPDANYRVFIQGEDARIWTVESKTTAGFTINSNSGFALSGATYWFAIRDGEHHQST